MREPPILRRRNTHLPYDIVLNILARLPAKSLMRFRCVSKSLDSSIKSHDFITDHLNTNKNHDNGYVIHMGSNPSSRSSNRPVCTVALDRSFDRISEFVVPFDFPFEHAGIVGQLNNVNIGFAYHSENNDYKVVRISYSPLSILEIEVYTLSLDSWRRVGFDLTINVFFCSELPAPLVNGALHWMAHIEGEETDLIMAFDVNSEKFAILALPDGFTSVNILQRCLASFKGKLAFITCAYNEQFGFPCQYSIWVMKEYGVVESWNKLSVILIPFERVACCLAFTEYGSLLLCCLKKRLESRGSRFVLVDTETLHEKEDPIQRPSYVTTFMESLILLDGADVESY
ncbi:hypothetical protein CMV_008260 [Castanea mollissima]|uniref:F-box domain-containing protein n=1 Tax=Castanea mollissima TaxID=60419 RepID=A0A8J4RKB8_9ROSI|nr:hypothetical protein CMV_008260 [Castanea mollissima]